MEHSIDSRLESRANPAMRREFPQQIIAAALRTPQRRSVALGEWLTRLFGEFSLPQPAYALAGMLVMGMLLGYMNPATQTAANGTDTQTASDDLFEDDGAVL